MVGEGWTIRGQDEEEGGGRTSQQVAGRGSIGGGGTGGDGGWVGACPRAEDIYGPRGRSGPQVPILVRQRPRFGAETLGKTISWNRPPRADRATMLALS